MKLIITIDAEEDNWGGYANRAFTTENITKLPELQALLDEFGAMPTYLVTYPVVQDERASAIIEEILRRGRCEIGAHCHPWNTPPHEEDGRRENRMLCSLPRELQYRKISHLHEAIRARFGVSPVGFRSGRWSYNADVASTLYRLGYTIDTSVTPYTTWMRYEGPDFTQASPRPYRFTVDDVFREIPDGPLLEVPPTIGFLQRHFALSNRILDAASRQPLARARLVGLLATLRVVNKVWLSPELSTGKEMIGLARSMMRNDYPLLNMIFHSTALQPGLTPFVRTSDDSRRFRRSLREFLVFARDQGVESIGLSQAGRFV